MIDYKALLAEQERVTNDLLGTTGASVELFPETITRQVDRGRNKFFNEAVTPLASSSPVMTASQETSKRKLSRTLEPQAIGAKRELKQDNLLQQFDTLVSRAVDRGASLYAATEFAKTQLGLTKEHASIEKINEGNRALALQQNEAEWETAKQGGDSNLPELKNAADAAAVRLLSAAAGDTAAYFLYKKLHQSELAKATQKQQSYSPSTSTPAMFGDDYLPENYVGTGTKGV